jgi:DNA-binding winged helix-turn-helix (wHTH) protein
MNNSAKHFYQFDQFRLEPAERLLLRNGQPVALTPKSFETLLTLVRNTGHLIEKDELMKEIWRGTIVEEVGLSRNISALRKALGDHRKNHKYIETVPGHGYRFVANVEEIWEDEARLSAKSGVVASFSETEQCQKIQRSAPWIKIAIPSIFLALFRVWLRFTYKTKVVNPVPSPNGKFVLLVSDGDIYLAPTIDGEMP